jgi:hypothetical protein
LRIVSTISLDQLRPTSRLLPYTVFLGFSCHWRFASWPMSSFPFSSMAKTEGTV